jgi:endonuclease/exonuclease/phosphatase (EEP) superfamily protein YafD
VYGLLALTNLAVLSPYLFPQTGSAFAGTRRLRVVTLNVHTANPRHDLVEAFLRHEDPDVIVLTEVDDRWLTQLAPLTNRWPHSVPAPRDDNFGIALFSRHPLRDARAVYLGEAGVPSIEAEVRFESGSVVVVGTHPLPPSGAENSGLRDGQLDQVGEHLAGRSGPRILLGDLNTTPWSPVIRRLLTRSGLKDSLRGRGYQPTWPSHFFLFWIPLDHCLVSDEVAVLARHVGPHVGSDHRPVIVDLGLAGPP